MKILHLSDTHSCHNRLSNLPDADVIVHSGDFTMNGTRQEAIDFMNWFCDLPYAHKIFICGNHDECLYGADIDGLDLNVHYLCNSGIEIDGVIFYGIPMFTGDSISGRQSKNYEIIPGYTDVIITHSPAYGILDFDDGLNYGSGELLSRLSGLNFKAHLFGHIHVQHGVKIIEDTVFSNGAVMNDINTPNVILI